MCSSGRLPVEEGELYPGCHKPSREHTELPAVGLTRLAASPYAGLAAPSDSVGAMTDHSELDEQRDEVDPDTRSQIRERLTWTPAQRLAYLVDVIAFERRARWRRSTT